MVLDSFEQAVRREMVRMTIEMDFRVEPGGAVRGDRPHRKQRSPSARHQALLELMKLFPETPLHLVAPDLQLGYPVDGPLTARAGDTDAYGLQIDTRLEYYCAGSGIPQQAVLAIVVEAQLGGEEDLLWRIWPYVGFVKYECRCATDIVILCQNRDLAVKFTGPMLLGSRGSVIVPRAVGPDDIPVITTLADAAADPGRLVLSAWYHSRCAGPAREMLVRLIVEVIGLLYEIDPDKATRYHQLAEAILPKPSARRLNEMTAIDITAYVGKTYHPEIWTPAMREGRKEGRRKRGAEDILTIMRARRIKVPADIREQILACDDLRRLNTWLKRAATASTASEVVTGRRRYGRI
jgi:hypothetical protein